MKDPVGGVVGFRVEGVRGEPAGFVRGQDGPFRFRRHAFGGKSGGEALQFRDEFEEVHDFADRRPRHHGTDAGTELDEADGGQRPQGLADRGPGDPEALCDDEFIQLLTGAEDAFDDLPFDRRLQADCERLSPRSGRLNVPLRGFRPPGLAARQIFGSG